MFTPGSSRKRQQRRENEDLSIDSSDETCASDNSQMDTDEESHEAHPSVEESFRIDEDDYDTSYAGEGSLVTDPNEHSSDQDSNGDPTEEGYDEAIEVMPRHVVYDKDFPQISQDLSKLATSVCGIIERSGCDNDRSKGCLEKAQRLTKTPDAEKEIVALIGDSGVGKSSLINSLIGIPKLARALSGGTSCTWVCTEYAAAPNEQEPPFSAFIHYKRKEEILDFLRKLLYDYKVYNLESTDEYDAAAKSELRQLSDTAVDIFRSLFCERQEFRSLQTGVECLNQLLEGSGIDDAAQDLGAWCMEILEARLAPHAEMIEVLHADDVKALHRHLDTLAKPIGQYKSTTYWPLIQRIRITIKDVEISQGVSFYDLPGTHDKNAVRLNATETVLRECDTIWIVADIARVITNRSVNMLLEHYGKDYEVAIICTMIDANADDDELVDELYLDDESKNRYESLIDDEKKIRKAKKSWTAKLNELKKQQATSRKKIHRHHNHAKDLSQQKSREMQAIESAINQHGIKLKKRQQESWRFVVEARNVFTKRRLSQDNRSFLPKDSSLNVFCVSNTHYAASKGVSFIHGNRLSVDQTGLPALRKFVRQQVAGAKLRAVEDYIRHDFTVFIQSLHLWCGLFSEADVNGLLCDIQAKQNEMQTIIAKCTNTLHKETSAIMLDHVEAGQIHMTKSALQVWKSKEKMHWQTLRAFIRQDGNHETQKVSHESWNEQFFKETIEFMGYSGEERLFGRLEKACNELEKSLLKLLDEIPRTVGQHAASVMLPEKPLNMFIEAEKYGIARHCEQFQASIRKEFRNAKLDLTVDRPSAFFAQAMAQAYRMCRNKRGRGSKENVQTTMKTHLSLGGPTSPFHQTADLFQKAIKMDIERTSAVLTKNVKVIMEQIHHHCSYMINAKKTDTSEEQLKVSLRDFLCGRDTGYQHFEDIKADLKRIKRRYIDVEA